MSNADTSGAAFPCALGWAETDMNTGAQTCVDVRDVSHGMTLRDYFAAKAMQGFSASPSMIDSNDSGTIAYVAAASYAMADAMLAARG